jgi:uncharacterized membrane protein
MSDSGSSAASSNRSLMVVLSYLWILFLVPLLVEKNDKEVQWHAKHGLVITVAELVLWVAIFIVQTVLGAMTAGLGCMVGILSPIIWLLFLVLRVICIIKGVNGQRFTIPGITAYVDRVNF